MVFRFCIILSFIGVFCSCSNNSKNQTVKEHDDSVIEDASELAPLVSEELFLKDKDPFLNEIIELQGEQIVADTAIFKVMEAECVIKDNLMLLKTSRNLILFALPEMTFLGFHGIWGNGPDEFIYPHIIPAPNDTTVLCYLFESINGKLYTMDKRGSISFYPFLVTESKKNFYSEKQWVNIAPNDFIFADDSPTGKSIYRATADSDSVKIREITNLALNPKRKSPFSYIGDFAVNANKNRMVYAYKYFKILKFMDLEAKTIRTINFEREQFDESSLYKVDGLDQNVTHYWGVCAQTDFVYFLYSGRTPMEVGRENSRGEHYIFVEQYDWNGNPIHKFKLDNWGYFTVDEANRKIYLLSTNHDAPFFRYQLP
jgi:hypothetical protein